MRKSLKGLVVLLFIPSCVKHDDRAITALRTLQKVESPTKIGVNLGQYNQLVANADTPVQEFLRDKEDKRPTNRPKVMCNWPWGTILPPDIFGERLFNEGITVSDEYVEKILKPVV